MNKPDQLIVGWGLAGVIMAWQSYFHKKSFLVFDSTVNTTTTAAAGIVNPIVFKRLTKSWQATVLMPFAENFYKEIESLLLTEIIQKKHIFKVFSSFEDENNWAAKQNDESFKSFLVPLKDYAINGVEAPYGYGEVRTFGNLNTKLFLEASKLFFQKKGMVFVNQKLDFNLLDPVHSTYDDHKYENIVFCEGVDVDKNPLFQYLPLKPTHGEVITIETDDFQFTDILNKNMFVMHIEKNLFKVGATYNWDLKEPTTTEGGKSELIKKLASFTNFKYKIVDHQAGIRPTVKDRRPLIGQHPKHDNIYIFNGLGTKGVMIAPYYSKQLFDKVYQNLELHNEVDISRYEKYFP